SSQSNRCMSQSEVRVSMGTVKYRMLLHGSTIDLHVDLRKLGAVLIDAKL
ncbi:hypothetical protein BCR37DRAFT_380958, partial [Protomyces lactucae-debilis]